MQVLVLVRLTRAMEFKGLIVRNGFAAFIFMLFTAGCVGSAYGQDASTRTPTSTPISRVDTALTAVYSTPEWEATAGARLSLDLLDLTAEERHERAVTFAENWALSMLVGDIALRELSFPLDDIQPYIGVGRVDRTFVGLGANYEITDYAIQSRADERLPFLLCSLLEAGFQNTDFSVSMRFVHTVEQRETGSIRCVEAEEALNLNCAQPEQNNFDFPRYLGTCENDQTP